ASEVFSDQSRVGDHTPHLLGRLARLGWPEGAQARIDSWRALLNDKTRRGPVLSGVLHDSLPLFLKPAPSAAGWCAPAAAASRAAPPSLRRLTRLRLGAVK